MIRLSLVCGLGTKVPNSGEGPNGNESHLNAGPAFLTTSICIDQIANLIVITSTLQSSAPSSLKIKFKMNLVETKTTIGEYTNQSVLLMIGECKLNRVSQKM